MRTKKLFVGVVLLCVVPLAMVYGQRTPGSFSVGGFGGVGLPMGPDEFKDYAKMSIGFGGEFKYNLTEMSSLAASFTYLPFKIDEDAIIEEIRDDMGVPADMEIAVEGGTTKMSIISANFIQYFTAPAASAGFYVTAGGGYYMYSMDDFKITITQGGVTVFEQTTTVEDSESDLGLNGGAGLEIVMGTNLFLFAEGKYHYVFTEDEATSFLTVMGGVRFTP